MTSKAKLHNRKTAVRNALRRYEDTLKDARTEARVALSKQEPSTLEWAYALDDYESAVAEMAHVQSAQRALWLQ